MATEASVMALIRAYRPRFRNAQDKLAFAVHASFLSAGYLLIGAGNRAFSAAESPSPTTPVEEVGIDGWNELDDCYGFVYIKKEKNSTISLTVKCLVMGDNLVIDVIRHGEEQKEPINLQINVNDYVVGEGTSSTNFSEMFKNLSSLINHVQCGILEKVENTSKSTSASSLAVNRKCEGLERDRHNPDVGIFTEPQPYPSGVVHPFPGIIDDANPGPCAGVIPSRGSSGIGGGMLMGPNDPRWNGGLGFGQPGFPGGIGGVPPGARFDPIGPPNVPGFEPGRFARFPRRPGGGSHPDAEHFPGGHDYFL